jgi:hypothetical protein
LKPKEMVHRWATIYGATLQLPTSRLSNCASYRGDDAITVYCKNDCDYYARYHSNKSNKNFTVHADLPFSRNTIDVLILAIAAMTKSSIDGHPLLFLCELPPSERLRRHVPDFVRVRGCIPRSTYGPCRGPALRSGIQISSINK